MKKSCIVAASGLVAFALVLGGMDAKERICHKEESLRFREGLIAATCDKCHGEGKLDVWYRREGRECPACHGKGMLVFDENRVLPKWQQGDFAGRLYRQMANNKDNLVFSPYGAASVCALVGAGAKGETAEAFKNTLGLSTDNPDEIAQIFGEAKQRLDGAFKVSDSIWLFNGIKPRDEFCRNAASAFHAESRCTTGGEAAMREINAYIENNTSGRIPQLLRCPPSPDTRMMAVNTLYLKAKWEQPFQAAWTKIRDFKTQTGKTVEVPFMDGQIFCAGYYKTKGLSVLTLPYRDCGLEMVFLLPDENISISRIEALLSESFLREIDRSILHKGDPYDYSVFEGVYVTIPKFEMAMRHDITQSLCWMGIGMRLTQIAPTFLA